MDVNTLNAAAETVSTHSGMIYAVLGAALAAGLSGIGSSYGVQAAGKASAGVVSEKPELFGKLLVLQALPATQGIYGLVCAIMIMLQVGLFSGNAIPLTEDQGLMYLCASLPMAIVGLMSGIYQGKTAASAIMMTGKQPDASGKGVTMTALVETYAILALLVTILLVLRVTTMITAGTPV